MAGPLAALATPWTTRSSHGSEPDYGVLRLYVLSFRQHQLLKTKPMLHDVGGH